MLNKNFQFNSYPKYNLDTKTFIYLQETCIWNCSQCGKSFVNSVAIKKHSEVCPASGSNKSVFSCHICETEYESSHHLNAHYAFHYKEELKAKIASDTTGMLIQSCSEYWTGQVFK